MRHRPTRALQELAAAIAEGEAIEWGEAPQAFSLEDNTRSLPALRYAARRAHSSLQAPGLALEVQRLESRILVRASVGLMLVCTSIQALLSCLVVFFGAAANSRVPPAPVLVFILTYLVAALVLVRREEFDTRVIWLAGFFFAAASSATQIFLPRLPLVFGGGPSAEIWSAVLPECFLPAFLWGFLREFPRVRRFDRTAAANRLGFRISVLAGGVLFAANLVLALRLPPFSTGGLQALAPLELNHPSGTFWLTLSVLSVVAPVVALFKRDLADSAEVGRVRWFLASLAIGVLPMFAAVVADATWPAFSQATDTPSGIFWSSWILYGSLMIVPVATAYAVLSRGTLSLRTALNGAAKFALMRKTLSALALLPAILLLRLVIQHSGEPLRALTQNPQAGRLLALTALGLVVLMVRPWLTRFAERHWLVKRAGLREALSTYSSDLLAARDLRTLDLAIEATSSALLGAEGASLLLSDEGTPDYRSVRHAHRDLLRSAALVQVVAAASGPVQTSADSSSSIFRVLPATDREWLIETGAAVITALMDSSGNIRGLLLIGPRRSGEIYGQGDLDLAGVLASTAAIALERFDWGSSLVRHSGGAIQPAGHCLHCGCISETSSGHCECGRRFEEALVPFELAGKFRLKAVLGRGGMGIVYLATDLALSRLVALKTLPELGATKLMRLRREARSMASVSHQNLATIHGVETFNGRPVLVMEYLLGGTLSERLTAPIPLREALRIALEVAAGLAELHDRSLLHRDIKPSNIAFGAGGVAKLLDFGLAKVVDSAGSAGGRPWEDGKDSAAQALTPASHAVGTPTFLSPEALAGAPATEAQDLWALHLVIWEMVSGRHPCQGLEQREALHLLRRAAIPSIRNVQPTCPDCVEELLIQGLHPEIAMRPSSAREIHRLLSRILEAV